MANRSAVDGPASPADSIAQVYLVDRHGTRTKPTDETAAELPSLVSICAAATWYGRQRTLLRHTEVAEFGERFTACLDQLVPEVEWMARALEAGDVEAETALVAVRTARMRMGCPEAAGLMGES